MFDILESIKQFNQPRSLDSRQDISFNKNMLHFIHLCKCPLSHLLERTYFPRIDLSSKVDGSVSSLTNLGDDPELLYPKLCTSFSEEDTFSTVV